MTHTNFTLRRELMLPSGMVSAESQTNESDVTEVRKSQNLQQYLKNAQRKPRPDVQSNLKVLLVDDDVESIIPMHLVLVGLGCEITIAFNGRSAINHLLKKPFDLVVLDWLMPDLGGDEVLKKSEVLIQKDPSIG